MSLREKDDLSWYARKAARTTSTRKAPVAAENTKRISELLKDLHAAGIKGDPTSMTLFTRRLPPGCKPCLKGEGTNLYITGLCTRDCFFCFNQKPRTDELVVHGIPIADPAQAAEIVERYGLKSVGISGGEPLLRPERVFAVLRGLRALGKSLRIDLYTNGDRADNATLLELKASGLDSIRFDAVARDYDLEPVERAMKIFDEVAVEIPVIPDHLPRLKTLCRELDALKVPFLNIHELFISTDNTERVLSAGEAVKDQTDSKHLLWKPTAASLECCLELLEYALKTCKTLSVYLCSCGTQDNISRRGWVKRQRRAIHA